MAPLLHRAAIINIGLVHLIGAKVTDAADSFIFTAALYKCFTSYIRIIETNICHAPGLVVRVQRPFSTQVEAYGYIRHVRSGVERYLLTQ